MQGAGCEFRLCASGWRQEWWAVRWESWTGVSAGRPPSSCPLTPARQSGFVCKCSLRDCRVAPCLTSGLRARACAPAAGTRRCAKCFYACSGCILASFCGDGETEAHGVCLMPKPSPWLPLLLSLLLLRLRTGVGVCGEGRRQGLREEHAAPCILDEAFSLCPVPPELVGDSDTLTNVTATLHSPLTLLCEATGVPSPVVHWFRGEEPVSPGEDTDILAGEVPARGGAGHRAWPPPLPLPPHARKLCPELPGLVGITISAETLVRPCAPGEGGFSKSGEGFVLCCPPGDSQ